MTRKLGTYTPTYEAEGQAIRTCLALQVTGRRLVSFLVSYMFVYLRLHRLLYGAEQAK